MIDLDKIGARIKEGRNFITYESQEKMAENLGMYQADISNLEKAKKGSGITDLMKLDMIAEYFGVPLETLVFGMGDMKLMKYYGKKMEIRPVGKKMPKTHKRVLAKLMGRSEEDDFNPMTHECGPYMIYSMIEKLMDLGCDFEPDENGNIKNARRVLKKLHTYIFYEADVIALMVTDLTTMMEHVFQPALYDLQQMIPGDVLDVTDVIRTVNPYWALWRFTEDGPEKEGYLQKLTHRMDELRQAGEDRPVLYVESVYVREDYRRNGMFRMYTDYLKMLFPGCILWLNMEPTTGEELCRAYSYLPAYTVSELGQVNMNASIAEKLGFTVDPDTWRREAERLDADGSIVIEPIRIRKCAYFLPKEIREILKNDGGLVELGRAKQRVMQTEDEEEETVTIDLYNGEENGYVILMMKQAVRSGQEAGRATFCYAAGNIEEDKYRFGVSKKSVLDFGLDHEGQLEKYEYLDDAEGSEFYEEMMMLNEMLTEWKNASSPIQID